MELFLEECELLQETVLLDEKFVEVGVIWGYCASTVRETLEECIVFVVL